MTVPIRLKLREFFEANNLRPAHVEQYAREKTSYRLGENTVYRMMGNSVPKRLDMEALGSILASASALLGREVNISEVLEWHPES